MKKIVIAFLFLLTVVPLVMAEDLRIRKLSVIYEDVRPIDGILVKMQLENFLDVDIEDVKTTIFIPELGVKRTFGPEDLEFDQNFNRLYFIPLPDDAPKGEYLMKVTVRNNDVRKVKYRFFEVVDDMYCVSC